jgi:hypothetical protein
MDTCGGDDTSYQIPIATTITFDGVQYSSVYATTNSVITFGQPDGTYWTYPSTPSISLYSMDWVSGWYNAPDTLNISYSEGGFQLDLEVIPFGQWATPTPSNINILVAITNTGGISVSYSYQGPEYPNLRTGVRLHDGSIVSLEAWGATQVQPENTQTLSSDPIVVGPTQEEIQQQEEIRVVNSLIAAAVAVSSDLTVVEPVTDPVQETPEESTPEPDIIVEPEIITPEDPRFPDEQTQPNDPTPTPDSGTTNEQIENSNLDEEQTVEPSPEPSPQPTDIDQDLISEPDLTPEVPSEESSHNTITEETANLIADLTNKDTLNNLTSEQKVAVAKGLGIKTSEIALVANLAKSNEAVAEALKTFSTKLEENKDAPMPYTLADAVTEAQTEKLLSDPIGALTNIDLEKVFSPSEWGKDMTDDQREKVQEVVIPVILVGNIVSSVMSLRRL